MAYDLNDLTGEFRERSQEGKLPEGHSPAKDLSDRSLELLNQNFNPLRNLGFEMGESGRVPERDGVPRIFMMQPDEDGVDRVQTLDQAGIQFGTREFWTQVQKGNVFAFPTGSTEPVQIQANIRPGSMPKASFSAPLDMEEIHKGPENHEYREPGRITRFLNRLFKNYRKADCEIYRQRQKLADMSEKREKVLDHEKEELKVAEKNAAAKAEKEAQKKAYETIRDKSALKQYGKDFYKDLVAPQPKYRPEHSRTEGHVDGLYSKEEFESLKPINKNVGDYEIGGQKLSMDEYCGLVMACSHDTKFVEEGFKRDSHYDETLLPSMMNAGYSEKDAKRIIVNSYSTMISDDLMKGDLRVNQGVQFEPTVNPARSMAFEILDEYKQGKPERLAEKIAEGVTQAASSTDQYIRTPHNGAFNRFEFTAAMADLMERDPKLKALAMEKGMKQEDLDAVKNMREYSKLDSKRDAAQTAIAKAVYEGKELTYQQKMQYSKDIINANIMESKFCAENNEREIKGKEIDKENDRLTDQARKDGLFASDQMKEAWKKNPGSRPLPPKGKLYDDQVITIISGLDYKYNKHAGSLSDFSDPNAIQDCHEITEEIVTSKGLADMSVKDLGKAILSPGNMFQGFKLVETVDNAVEKINERKLHEELGIDNLDLDKEGNIIEKPEDASKEKLNTGVNYGNKAPKFEEQQSGPML